MKYYEVIPASGKYHGKEGLTYSSGQTLDTGQLVSIEIRGLPPVVGFITRSVQKPDFAVRPLHTILENLVLSSDSLNLFYWLQQYYPGPAGALASQFLPANLLTHSKELVPEIAPKMGSPTNKPPLSQEQQTTLNFINNQESGSFLIHGETGSGKTRVYTELAQQQIKEGKSVLVLTPEISLTPQLVDRFKEAFGEQVGVTHSSLTPAQRKRLWLKLLRASQPSILIGPRSALFMPLARIGLIIIDEFHDAAYKQENTPYYQALRVASKLAELQRAKLVLGSATPSINEYYFARQKEIPVLRMITKPAQKKISKTDITTHIVNLSNSDERTKYPLVSATLIRELEACLARGEQAMIFLNKRGSTRAIVCQTCGWQALCPRCDLPLVYHGDSHTLACHTCGLQDQTPSTCPSCAGTQVLFKSPGTKAVATFLESLFPQAIIARFDKDNKKSERLEARHSDIKDGSIDILVGTQLLTKGHDLPNLSLVGILLAETGLIFPDYTAEERSYQIIHQLLGRVGRGHRPGHGVIQTFDPNNVTIKAAVSGSWEDFYDVQLAERKAFGFPPFYHVMKIHVVRRSQAGAKKAAEKLLLDIRTAYTGIILIGPAPSFIEKHGQKWHWQIIVKAKKRSILVGIVNTLPRNIPIDIDPGHLL